MVNLARLSASGLLAIGVPARFGGPGGSVLTLAEAHQRIAGTDPGAARLLHGHHLFLRALAEQGTPEQQEYFFTEALGGACFAGIGAGFGGPQDFGVGQDDGPPRITLARWRNGVYRLDGEAGCGAGVLLADWLVVRAVLVDELAEPTDDPDEVFAVIRRDDLGVTHEGDPGGTVWLDGVRVAAGCVIPYSTLFDRPSTYLARARLTEAALGGPDGDLLREAARAVDRAESDQRASSLALALEAVARVNREAVPLA